MIADQLEVRFVAAPIAITTWFSYDAGYSLHVRADFRTGEPAEPVEAGWFTPSNQVSPADGGGEFWSPVPNFVAQAAEQWQAIPMTPGDVIYRQSRRDVGPVGSVGWALVRRRGDVVTLHFVQHGNENEMRKGPWGVLTEEPIDMGWEIIPSQAIYKRSGP